MLDAMPNVSPEVVRRYRREASDQKRVCDEENAKLRNIYKRAEKDGIIAKLLRRTMKAQNEEPETVLVELRTQVYYMAVTKFPTKPPADLFAEISISQFPNDDQAGQDESDWEAHDRGYRAGRAGAPAGDNPFPPGVSEFVKWAAGHREGVAAQEQIDGPGMKQADASRERKKKGGDKPAADPAVENPFRKPGQRGRPTNAEKEWLAQQEAAKNEAAHQGATNGHAAEHEHVEPDGNEERIEGAEEGLTAGDTM